MLIANINVTSQLSMFNVNSPIIGLGDEIHFYYLSDPHLYIFSEIINILTVYFVKEIL